MVISFYYVDRYCFPEHVFIIISFLMTLILIAVNLKITHVLLFSNRRLFKFLKIFVFIYVFIIRTNKYFFGF